MGVFRSLGGKEALPLFMTLAKALIAYILLRLTIQLVGMRQVGQATLLELALVLSLAFLAGLGALWPAPSLAGVASVYLIWLALFALERYVLMRNRNFRQSLAGNPTMLIYQGKLLEHNLYRKRLTPEQLLSKLRAQSIFDLCDVEMAVLEPDGVLSVLRNPQAEPLTKQDMLVAGRHKGMPTEVIVDGEVIHDNLQQRGLTEKWLRDHLRAFNVEFVGEVALATVDDNQQLYVDTYNDGLEKRGELHNLAAKQGVRGYADAHPLQEKPQSTYERKLADYNLQKAEKDSYPQVPKKK